MTIQITVRLPDDEVQFLDDQVAAGRATSRAAAVSAAVRRERRRLVAIRDLEILTAAEHADPDDLDGLARHAARRPLDLD